MWVGALPSLATDGCTFQYLCLQEGPVKPLACGVNDGLAICLYTASS